MRRRIAVVICLALAVGVVPSKADWKMRIHRGGLVDEFYFAEIDSIDFAGNSHGTPPGMVRVPAGVFIMGDGETEWCGIDEREVTLTRDFYLGQYEVTNQEYLEALQWAYDHGHVTVTSTAVRDNMDGSSVELLDLDSEYSEIQFDGAGSFYLRESPSSEAQSAYPGGYDPADHPVKMVNWYGAARFCDWLSLRAGLPKAYEYVFPFQWQCNGGDPYGAWGYRLPTDAEWEYAAQFNDDRMYPWGNVEPACMLANGHLGYPCVGWTKPVGSYPAAPQELGLADMAGNVWELCNDIFDCNLGGTPEIDPVGPLTGNTRVYRGGSWSVVGYYMRCAMRETINQDDRYNSVGFRTALTAYDYRIQVHQAEEVDEFILAEVDSLTCYEDVPPTVPDMISVPAGVFTMGDGVSVCGVDEHEVTLTRDFYLGQFEVTNQQYLEALQWAYHHGYVTANTDEIIDNLDGSTRILLRMSNQIAEIQFDGAGNFYLRESPTTTAQNAYPDGYDPANHPAMYMTWFGAARYCDWLSMQAGLPRAYEHSGDWSCNGGDPYGAEGYRLPTDAEWEYAAQWNDERIYPWGNEPPVCSRANYSEDFPDIMCIGWTAPVGSYPGAPAQLGFLDMAGNVSEMCNDWYVCDLGTAAQQDPLGPLSGADRVLHGGAWGWDNGLPCANRSSYHPAFGASYKGFRIARTIAPAVPEIVRVPAGVFIMGDGVASCGTAQHQVTLTRDFYVGQYEVTNQEYMEALQWAYEQGYVTVEQGPSGEGVLDHLAGGAEELLDLDSEFCEIQFDGAGSFYLRESPSWQAQGAYPNGYDPGEHPVKEVSWYGAARYCDWLSLQSDLPRAYRFSDYECNDGDPYGAEGYRLLTDAEWEYAAQFNDERIYPWGNEEPDCSYANFDYAALCVGWTSPVGSYPDAPLSIGLSDMAGNLWEWVNDRQECDLGTTPVVDPTGPNIGSNRLLRGGAWSYFNDAFKLRCANRYYGLSRHVSTENIGFRIARTVEP